MNTKQRKLLLTKVSPSLEAEGYQISFQDNGKGYFFILFERRHEDERQCISFYGDYSNWLKSYRLAVKIGHTASERISPIFGWDGMKASVWEIAGFNGFVRDEIYFNDEYELTEWLDLLIPIIMGVMKKWFDLEFDYDSRINESRMNRKANDLTRLEIPLNSLRAATLPKEVLETLQNALNPMKISQ